MGLGRLEQPQGRQEQAQVTEGGAIFIFSPERDPFISSKNGP